MASHWLGRQPPARRRLYLALLAIPVLTVPCYATGFVLLAVGRPQDAGAAATPTPSATLPAIDRVERATSVPEDEPTGAPPPQPTTAPPPATPEPTETPLVIVVTSEPSATPSPEPTSPPIVFTLPPPTQTEGPIFRPTVLLPTPVTLDTPTPEPTADDEP